MSMTNTKSDQKESLTQIKQNHKAFDRDMIRYGKCMKNYIKIINCNK